MVELYYTKVTYSIAHNPNGHPNLIHCCTGKIRWDSSKSYNDKGIRKYKDLWDGAFQIVKTGPDLTFRYAELVSASLLPSLSG